MTTTEAIGWAATAMFAASYLFRNPRTLRVVQALAAAFWILYGLRLDALPVIISNLAVGLLAVGSLLVRPGNRSWWPRSRVQPSGEPTP